MKFLLSFTLTFLSMFAVIGCSTATCTVESSFNTSIATELNTLASCTNTSAIEAQLTTWEAPLNLCPSGLKALFGGKQKGIVSDICVSLIPIVEQEANSEKYLSAWGCDLTKATSLTQLLTQACGLIPATLAKPKLSH